MKRYKIFLPFFCLIFLHTSLYAIDSKAERKKDDTNFIQFQLPNNLELGEDNNASDTIARFSLLINGMNNIITTYGIILGVVSLFAVILGFIGFYRLESRIKKSEKKIKEELEDIIAIKTKLLLLEKNIELYSKYMEGSSSYLFNILNKVTDKYRDKKTKEELLTNIQRLNLYSTAKIHRLSALQYFSIYATSKHLEDIQFIIDNDSEDDIISYANQVLGRIKERESEI